MKVLKYVAQLLAALLYSNLFTGIMYLVILLLLSVALLSCSGGSVSKKGQFYDSQEDETGEVWVCLGRKSHAYHSNSKCYGRKACRGEKKKITKEKAVSMERTPCHYCHKEEDVETIEPYDPDTYDPTNAWSYDE